MPFVTGHIETPFTLADVFAVTTGRAVFRMLLSLIIGGVVGIEREYQGRAAGFRTHMLVSLGCCVFMLLSLRFADVYGDWPTASIRADPARIAYGVVAGIGFLAAGVILKSGQTVHGLTTAASLWSVSALGMAVGMGAYAIGIIGAALTVFTLLTMRHAEHLVRANHYRQVRISRAGLPSPDPVISALHAAGGTVLRTQIVESSQPVVTTVTYEVRFEGDFPNEELHRRLRACGDFLSMEVS